MDSNVINEAAYAQCYADQNLFVLLVAVMNNRKESSVDSTTSTIITIDTVSATQMLAARGSSFNTSNEVATSIDGTVIAKLADALMVALGPPFESFSGKDVTAIFELYKATPCVAATTKAVKVPEAPECVAEQ